MSGTPPYVRKTLSVYERPRPARLVLAEALGITLDEAGDAIVALVEAGYGIAPRQPTNGMLAAYIEATAPPKHHEATITAIGKARVRWQAMLLQGTEMALSLKFVPAPGIVAAAAGETRQGLDERSEQSPVGEAETPK